MHIGIDFDHTIVDYHNLFAKGALSLGYIDACEKLTKDVVKNKIKKLQDGENKWGVLQSEIYSEGIRDASIMIGFPEFVVACQKSGINLSIISHKTKSNPNDPFQRDFKQAAPNWMQTNQFFNYVKDQCVIINTARGRIIDFQALYDALKKGIVSAIGLDVLPEEPPNKKNPLISAWMNNEKWLSDRIIITPHSAFFSNDSFNEMRLKAAQEAKRVLKGDHPQNCVNKLYLSK